LSHVTAVLVAAPFILLCAALSWHCVERPVLMWCRGRLARRQAPRPDSVPVSEQAVR
jgi:peptidoglycan/LPS O-acetylase OafA/YrhL